MEQGERLRPTPISATDNPCVPMAAFRFARKSFNGIGSALFECLYAIKGRSLVSQGESNGDQILQEALEYRRVFASSH